MFNPDAKDAALAPCMYTIDEITLPNFLPGVVFTDVSLSLEVSGGDVYIDEVCLSEGKNFRAFTKGNWMFENFVNAIYQSAKWNERIIEACKEAAQ